MSTITTERCKESMEKFCSLIHWSHVPRRWMTSVLRRIFPAFRSTRFNDLLLHATSIVTFEKQNVVLNDMEARGHRLSFSHWSGPAVAMRCPLFFSSRHRRNARWAHRLRSLSRPGFREYTSHRPKLRIFIGLTLLVESERGPRNQKKKV